MARGVNKVIIIGNLGKDPESKYLPSGDCVVNFSLATSESWKDKSSGEKVEKTEWHNCVAFRRLAEVIVEYCRKGSQIYIEGKLKTRTYEKDGQTHYATEIEAYTMQMLGGRGDSDAAPRNPQMGGATPAPAQQQAADYEDDIPF